jgi:hypothetical protein
MDRYKRLLGDLLAGIDDASRAGLAALDRPDPGPDRAGAAVAAAVVAERIEHVLSLTSSTRATVPPVEKFVPDARIAFGHAQELANRLAVEVDGSDALADALEGVATAPGIAGRWRWRALGLQSGRIAGPFSFSREHRIISGTLLLVADHVERALSTIDAATLTAAAGAIAEDLGHATRALLRTATHDPVRRAFHPHVNAAMDQLGKLDKAAFVRGLTRRTEVVAVDDAAHGVRAAVGLVELPAAFAL